MWSIKRLWFDHAVKWYKQKLEFILEHDTHKILLDFLTQTDHLIPTWKPDLVQINKKKEIFINWILLF